MNRRTKTSKWLAVILAVVLMLSTVPFTIVYAANVGTLNELKTAIQNNQDINLTSNITLDSWSSLNYSGNLNGNGYVIYTPNALFNQLSGSVTDLGVLTSIPTFSDTAVLAKNVTATGAVEGCFAYGTIQNTSTGTVIGGLNGNGVLCFDRYYSQQYVTYRLCRRSDRAYFVRNGYRLLQRRCYLG